jgi:hypothetical protein
MTLSFEKNAIFALNWQKSQKSVIISDRPDHFCLYLNAGLRFARDPFILPVYLLCKSDAATSSSKFSIAFSKNYLDAEQGCQMVYIFSNQKSKFGQFFVSLTMEDVGIFYGNLV